MQFDEKKLRAFLLRQVANCNRRIVGIMHDKKTSNRSQYNGGFNEILTTFAGGMYTPALNIIFDNMSANPQKRYSPYNYFDIDTLYAFYKFLNNVIAETDANAYLYGRKYSTAQDFSVGIKNARKILENGHQKKETGYYNKNNPITLAYTNKNGVKILNPEKSMTQEAFDKKYNYYECKKELEEYVSFKHSPAPIQLAEPPLNEDFDSADVIEFKHDGTLHKLRVDKREYYTGAQGEPVISIEASADIGTLYAVYNVDGSVYRGDLYDQDGNFLEHDAGGETFFPRTKSTSMTSFVSKKSKANKSQNIKASDQPKKKSKKYDPFEDEDQMKLF